MRQPYRKNTRFFLQAISIPILLLALNIHGFGDETAERTASALQSATITEEFRQLFINTCAYMKQCTKYTAQGEILTHIKSGDEDTRQSYPFVLSRNGVAHFSISVYREGGTDVVLRLLSAGRPGTAKFYLPREINPWTFLERIQEQPEGLTAPVSEQRRAVRQLRNNSTASGLKSKARQMGLSPQEMQRIRSLAQ